MRRGVGIWGERGSGAGARRREMGRGGGGWASSLPPRAGTPLPPPLLEGRETGMWLRSAPSHHHLDAALRTQRDHGVGHDALAWHQLERRALRDRGEQQVTLYQGEVAADADARARPKRHVGVA